MKYLLQAIDAQRSDVRLSDHELRDLLVEVRSGKDDRIEFIDAMARLLDELKGSEHATAFLNKVAKRDAPDYYDVIKNPMDLGTMMRNVRSGRYKSKAQFTRDLDLIWDNCLTYNSEPTHPLRKSVQILRAKANHLLTYVNDTNDVKEALNQWQKGLGLTPQSHARKPTVALLGAEEARTPASSASDVPPSMAWAQGMTAGLTAKSERPSLTPDAREGSAQDGAEEATAAEGAERKADTAATSSSLLEAPFEQRPAILRNAAGMEMFARLDASLRQQDAAFAQRFMLDGESNSKQAGPSSRPMLTAPPLTADADLETLKMLEASNKGGVLRSALHVDTDEGQGAQSTAAIDTTGNDVQEKPVAAAAESSSADAWWNSTSHPTLLSGGISRLTRSQQNEAKRLQRVGGRVSKRRRRAAPGAGERGEEGAVVATPADDEASASSFGKTAYVPDNVETIVKLRRTHAKYGSLIHHIESGDPIPADLAVISSDEEDENEDKLHDKRRSSIRDRLDDPSGALPQSTARRKARQQKADDVLELPAEDILGNPYPKLGSESAKKLLEHRVQLVFAHAGFEGSQRGASNVLADVAGEFMMNLGRAMRSYTDRFAREMSVEELIMHTLFENGGADICSLESYVRDDVQRHGHKMADLLRKLRSSYRDTLSTTDLVMADEVAFFAGSGDAASAGGLRPPRTKTSNGIADDDGDGIMRGGLALDVADEDYFGFKDMGLDEELGVDVGRQLAQLPSRMFQRRQPGDGGLGGKGGKGAGSARDGKADAGDEEIAEFPPPPPFVPLSEAAISAQIGLLQPFYRDLIRSRGQWMRDDAHGEGDENAGPVQNGSHERPPQEGDARHEGAYLVLPDEEQERQRYKVPPTGRMPKRMTAQKLREAKEEAERAASKKASASSASALANASTLNVNGKKPGPPSMIGSAAQAPKANGKGQSTGKKKQQPQQAQLGGGKKRKGANGNANRAPITVS